MKPESSDHHYSTVIWQKSNFASIFVHVLSDFLIVSGNILSRTMANFSPSVRWCHPICVYAHRLISWPWAAPYIQALFEKWPLSSLHPGLSNWHLFLHWYINYRAYQWNSCWARCQASSVQLHWKVPCLDKKIPRTAESLQQS